MKQSLSSIWFPILGVVVLLSGCGKDSPAKPTLLLPPVWVASWGDSGAAPGPFGFPTGIAVGPNGNAYVANTRYDRIEVISPEGTHLATWGHHGYGPGEFVNPVSVAVGPGGKLAVGENLGRVQLFDSTGVYLRTLQFPTSKLAMIEVPAFVDIADAGSIFVCYSSHLLVARYSADGEYESVWPADSSAVRGLGFPAHLAATRHGEIYLTDWSGGDVRLATAAGHLIRRIDWFRSGVDRLKAPWGVDVDSEGRLFVADRVTNRVSIYNGDGSYLLSWGEQGSGPGQFEEPGGVALGPNGLIYVTDIGNDRVQVFRWSAP